MTRDFVVKMKMVNLHDVGFAVEQVAITEMGMKVIVAFLNTDGRPFRWHIGDDTTDFDEVRPNELSYYVGGDAQLYERLAATAVRLSGFTGSYTISLEVED